MVAQDAAKSVRFLKHLRITHVLNTAEGRDENLVDLSAAHFEGTGIEYKVCACVCEPSGSFSH